MPSFPTVGFYLVDYVSGTVADAANAASASGYAGMITLADTGHVLQNGFQGTMGTTLVIDSGGTVLMNEDYKDGSKLSAILAGLP